MKEMAEAIGFMWLGFVAPIFVILWFFTKEERRDR